MDFKNFKFDKNSLLKIILEIIVGIILVVTVINIIPVRDFYDDLTIKNLDLTREELLTKYTLIMFFISILLFLAGFLLVKFAFYIPSYVNKFKATIGNKKQEDNKINDSVSSEEKMSSTTQIYDDDDE